MVVLSVILIADGAVSASSWFLCCVSRVNCDVYITETCLQSGSLLYM